MNTDSTNREKEELLQAERSAKEKIPSKRNNIILIGMPGSGKSTVGVLLAKTLGMGFVDTDLVIQNETGRLLYRIIEEDGITSFIRTEENVLKNLVCENCVIATGGSAVYGEEAMEHMSDLGYRVYLRLPCGKIEKRLGNIRTRGVVMRRGETIKQLYEERIPLYEKYADVTVCGDGTPEDVVFRILDAIPGEWLASGEKKTSVT